MRGSGPRLALQQPARTLFLAAAPGVGTELWATTGAPGSVTMLDEVTTGDYGVQEMVTHPNGTVILSSYADGIGFEPFAIPPGASGYTPLGDLKPGLEGSSPRALVVWQNDVWFLVDDGTPGYQLYRTDGTVAGTQRMETLLPSVLQPNKTPGVQVGNGGTHLYLSFTGAGSGGLLVKSSPSAATVAITPGGRTLEVAQFGPTRSAPLNTGAVFVMESAPGQGYEPWFTDGTSAGTLPLGPLNPTSIVGSLPSMRGSDGNRVWFDAITDTEGTELWTTDGTPGGTRILVDLVPGPGSGRLESSFTLLAGGDAVFGASNTQPLDPPILFRSDGTASGTRAIPPSPTDGQPTYVRQLILAGGLVWGIGQRGFGDSELWSYNPVLDALRLRWIPRPQASSSRPVELLGPTPNGLLLAIDDGIFGKEPWIFDPAGTGGFRLANLYPDGGTRDSRITALGSHTGVALYHAADGTNGPQLYASDGTASGTRRITRHVVDPGRGFVPVTDTDAGFVYLTEQRLFPGQSTTQLWSTDGTVGGEVLLHDFRSGSETIFLDRVVPFGDRALLRVGRFGNESWWITDGTPAGTAPYAEFAGFAELRLDLEHQGLLWGTNRDAARGRELWVSDGTAAGTRAVLDIAPGPASSDPAELRPVAGGILFAADDRVHGAEPWFSDGTPTGTRLILDAYPGPFGSRPVGFTPTTNGHVFRAAAASTFGELWRTDATAAGTFPLGNVRGAPARFAAANGRALFWNEIVSPSLGNVVELWRTDGTASGTFGTGAYVQEFDTANAPPLFVLGDGDEVAFQGFGATHGVELWLSDGTVAGTRVLADSAAGPEDSLPMDLIRAGNHLLFTADSLAHGRELHGIPYAPTGAWLARPFGRGCGAELAVSGSATLGASLTLDVSSAPGAATALLFGLDRDDTALAPGCFRHVAVPITVGALTADAQGVASFPLAVPNVPALVGDLLHFQAFAAVPGGPLLGAVAGTPGLEVVLGG